MFKFFLDMIQIILFILANKLHTHTHTRNLFGTRFNYNESSRKKLEIKKARERIYIHKSIKFQIASNFTIGENISS